MLDSFKTPLSPGLSSLAQMPTVPLVNTILGESFRALAEVLGCYFLLKNVFEKMGRGLFDLSPKRFRVLGEVQVLLFSFHKTFSCRKRGYIFSSFSKTFPLVYSRNVSYDKIRFICVISLLNGQLLTPLVRVAALADTLP